MRQHKEDWFRIQVVDEAGGRVIYLEGTYTSEFSANPSPTPRYDYDQILNRLDLAGARSR